MNIDIFHHLNAIARKDRRGALRQHDGLIEVGHRSGVTPRR